MFSEASPLIMPRKARETQTSWTMQTMAATPDRLLLQPTADLRADGLLIEHVERAEERAAVQHAGDAGGDAGDVHDLLHVAEEAELGALADDVLRDAVVVLLRIGVRPLAVGVGLI